MTEIPTCYSYIRFSTPTQLKGDSLRRQITATKDFVEKKGWKLDESLKFQDLGLSAYSGDNRTKGALGRFMELAKSGQIPPGSKLIVESLDRLSRSGVTIALSQFLEIIACKIAIITLDNEKEYHGERIDVGDLMFSLTIMSRAHEESSIKAQRLREAWKNKRDKIKKRKLTSRGPAWLRLDKKKQVFEPIPDRYGLIERIFHMYLDGNGADAITRAFNAERIPAWRSKDGWHKSYIQKILHNRAVIGEFQPHKMEKSKDGKKRRVPAGEPVKNYFPPVIAEQDFHRVQQRLMENKSYGGRNGSVKNLFGHVAKCGYCGSPMYYLNKGNGDEYLMCGKAQRGAGCKRVTFRYRDFEQGFLECCSELDVGALMPADHDQNRKRIAAQRQELEALDGQLTAIEKQIRNINRQIDLADESEGADAIIKHANERLAKVLKKREVIFQKQTKASDKLNVLLSRISDAKVQLESVNQLMDMMANADDTSRSQIRMHLRQTIRQLVKRIEVFPEGQCGRVAKYDRITHEFKYESIRDQVRWNLDHVGSDIEAAHGKAGLDEAIEKALRGVEQEEKATTGKEQRCFGICFEAGGFRQVAFPGDGTAISIAGRDDLELFEAALPHIRKENSAISSDEEEKLLKALNEAIPLGENNNK
jgi:DNA invertase Pin-like site-specific DNA recombinase/cell division protein FtsB